MDNIRKIRFILAILLMAGSVPVLAAEENGSSADDMLLAASASTQASGGNTHLSEVVVSATRLETAVDEVGSSVTVITADELEKQGKTTMLEALRGVTSLDVVQTGSYGAAASVMIRGAKSEHTLVIIDGVVMNDPSQAGHSFDFSCLSLENIERIEILRGPQSTLYGSDAIGGVINIITKKGSGPPSGTFSVETGTYKTVNAQAGFSAGSDMIQYSAGVSHLRTVGFSTKSKEDGNDEKDGYKNVNASCRLDITPTENFDAGISLRYIEDETDLDGSYGDDPNYIQDTRQLFLRTQMRLALFNNLWEQKLGFSFSNVRREYVDDPDEQEPDSYSESTFKGSSQSFDWQHNFYLHETNTLTMGADTKQEKMNSESYSESFYGPYSSEFGKKRTRVSGFYLQDSIKLWDSWFTTLGGRVDKHTRYGSNSTCRATTSYLVRKTVTRFKGSYGTGFKAPSLYQLYSPYGSEDMQPEKSIGWDLGLEQAFLGERLSMGATYFKNEFKEMIDFDMNTWRYTNVSRAQTEGVETFIRVRPLDGLDVKAAYTYTETEDKDTGEELARRAKDKVCLDVDYSYRQKANLYMGIVYTGKRYDSTGEQLVGYTVCNLAASYALNDKVKFTARVENLFDKEYEQAHGYGCAGRCVHAGVTLKL